MCGECTELAGLHVPEDLVHLDVYDPRLQGFVRDGDCGRGILTSLLPVGGKSGMLLLNYDTEDSTPVLSRKRCGCGRTHMRIYTPQREAETTWIFGISINRVDVKAAVFQRENPEYSISRKSMRRSSTTGRTQVKLSSVSVLNARIWIEVINGS